MSEIKHQWNGTVLTVISDSGASSADLVGPKGDRGPRGPQGPGGIIYNEDGEIVVDLSEYYSKSEVDDMVANVEVDLSDYATKSEVLEVVTNEIMENGGTNENEVAAIVDERINANEDLASKAYVSTEIAKAQLAEVAGDVDLSGFATKDDIKIDNQSIIKQNGVLQARVGGGFNEGLQSKMYNGLTLNEVGYGTMFLFSPGTILANQEYCIKIVFADGVTDTIVIKFPTTNPGSSSTYTCQVISSNTTYVTLDRPFMLANLSDVDQIGTYSSNAFEDIPVSYIAIEKGHTCSAGPRPINADFIPVDGETIIINSQGKLQVVGGAGSLASSEEVYY